MQCRDVRDLADAFIGEELLVETSHDILRHLETCPDCREEIRGRRALRAQLASAFLGSRDLAPDTRWLASLRAQLERAAGAPASSADDGLDSPARLPDRATNRPADDATLTATRAPFARSVIRPWMAVAAAVIVAAAAGALWVPSWRGSSVIDTLARLAVGDHRNCAVRFNLAERPVPLAQAAAANAPESRAYAVLARTPADSTPARQGDIVVVDRHVCVYEGRRFAHVVMRYRGELVSMLVTGDDGGPLTRVPLPAAADGADVAATPGSTVIYNHAGRHAMFFVTEGASDVLHEVASAMSASVARQLAGA